MTNRSLVLATVLGTLLVGSSSSLGIGVSILWNWATNAAPIIAMALAAGIVLSCGQIDISSGAAFSFAGMWALLCANAITAPAILVVISGTVIVVAVYWASTILMRTLGISSLLCTLGIGFCLKAITVLMYTYIKGVGIFSGAAAAGRLTLNESEFAWLFSSTARNLLLIALVVAALHYWRYGTDWGIKHIAVGQNEQAARRANVNADAIHLRAFVLAALLVAFSSWTYLFDSGRGAWNPDLGWGRELIAIAAAVIGGTRVTGGRFDPTAVSLAAIVLYAIRDVADSLHLPPDFSLIIMGVGLLVAGAYDRASEPQVTATRR